MKIFKTKNELMKYIKESGLKYEEKRFSYWTEILIERFGVDEKGEIKETYFWIKDKYWGQKVWIVREGRCYSALPSWKEEEELKEFLRNH